MNTSQRLPTDMNNPYTREFQQVIQEKSQNFVGREFVFTTITEFFQHYRSGYYTIVGAPGSGKSAIIAKYVTENPGVVYYNVQVEGKNQAEEFLRDVCTQLIERLDNSPSTPPQPSPQARREQELSLQAREKGFPPFTGGLRGVLPDNATEGSWFLSLLLQKISDKLEPSQRLIIAIDALDAIDPDSQPSGTNLFYLPRYLPDKVYFILTRRPFKSEKSGLLIETPSQTLDLSEYPQENYEDVQAYIRRNLTPFPTREGDDDNYSPPLLEEGLGERSQLCDRLTNVSENNFMYVYHFLNAMPVAVLFENPFGERAATIAAGFDSEVFQFDRIPPGLEAYYRQHWQKMQGDNLSSMALAVLQTLVQQLQPISAETVAQIINEDAYDVEEVMESWYEFLQPQQFGRKTRYGVYHSNFRNWLARQINLG
jgi:AAA ATPase domain